MRSHLTEKILAAGLLAGALAWAQPTMPRPNLVRSTGAFSIWPGQVARLQVSNLVTPIDTPTPVVPPDRTCSVLLRFVDGNGRVLKNATVAIPAGQTRALEFTPLEASLNARVTLRAEVQAAVPSPTPVQGLCNTAPLVEVVDSDGRTRFVVEQASPFLLLPAARAEQ